MICQVKLGTDASDTLKPTKSVFVFFSVHAEPEHRDQQLQRGDAGRPRNDCRCT
eukprot:COSAG06_NODE_4567_length_4140_cov_2.536996_4_plen_54_part_00